VCSAPKILAELPVSTPSQKEEAEGVEEAATMASPSLNFPVQITNTQKPAFNGGIRPVNRLGATPQATNPPLVKPDRVKEKAFDLTGPEKSTQLDQRSTKRQRTEGPSTPNHGSSRSPIDLEEVSGDSSRHARPPSLARSGQSQTNNGQRRTDSFGVVDEYHAVEGTMNPPRQRNRNSGPLGGHLSNGGGSNRFRKAVPTPTVVRLVDDDIEDDELASTQSKPIKNSNSKLEVQIPAPQQSSYKGNGFKFASRPIGKMWGNGTSKATSKTSEYWANQNGAQRLGSSASRSKTVSTTDRNFRRTTRQDDDRPSQSKSSIFNTHYEDEASLDELSTEQIPPAERKHFQVAQQLLRKEDNVENLSAASRGSNSRQQSIVLEDSSDDENRRKKSDMQCTNFGNSKKVKQPKPSGEERFDVLQVYCPSHRWLVSSENKTWSLHENCKAGLLSFFDDQGAAVPGLVLNPKSITKYMRADNYPKIVIHKSSDSTAHRSSKICVEFSERDAAITLLERIKKAIPNVGDLFKER
jgi:hypothetical protein